MTITEINIPIRQDLTDKKFHDLYIVLRNENAPSQPVGALDWIRFEL
jgi:hypothetical protein